MTFSPCQGAILMTQLIWTFHITKYVQSTLPHAPWCYFLSILNLLEYISIHTSALKRFAQSPAELNIGSHVSARPRYVSHRKRATRKLYFLCVSPFSVVLHKESNAIYSLCTKLCSFIHFASLLSKRIGYTCLYVPDFGDGWVDYFAGSLLTPVRKLTC